MTNKFSHIPAPSVDTFDTGLRDIPPTIPNSELQLDADISSFYLAWTDDTLAQNIEALKKHIEVKRLMSGCETVNLHCTRGAKAGRDEAAMVQKYQDNRKNSDPERKARADELRVFMETYSNKHTVPFPQWEIEADDSMSIRQLECMREGRVSKIMTLDKDLDMVDGTHIHYDTFEEWTGSGYGKLWLDRSGKTVKLKGQGKAFFWAQMLMGDKADHIPGLPRLSGKLLNKYKPTNAVLNAQKTLSNMKGSARAKAAAQKVLDTRKSAAIGPALAYEILATCKNDLDAFKRVREAYSEYYGHSPFEFKTWRGDTVTMTSGQMLLEQGKLLWMLRHPKDDVLHYIQEIT